MDTKRFCGNKLGIKINNITELTIYNQLEHTFGICDEEEYYFDDCVVYTDVDGNEQKREANKDERFERLVKALNDGEELYATFYVDCGSVEEQATTRLTSRFEAGQEVFVMCDNKICTKLIQRIVLSSSRGVVGSYDKVKLDCYYRQELNNTIQMDKNDTAIYVLSKKKQWSYVDRNWCYYDIDIRKEQEIFATREELINHLIMESSK